MIKTTAQELGAAYNRASREIMKLEPTTPRIMGHYWREQFGLHHKHRTNLLGKTEFWIEFPNDADYTAFIVRFA